MEFVVVRCSDGAARSVFVDAVKSGKTDQVLEVQKGTHSFALCGCADAGHVKYCRAARYLPVQQRVQVRDTISIDPLEVRFERVEP